MDFILCMIYQPDIPVFFRNLNSFCLEKKKKKKKNCLDSLSLPRYMEQEHAENIQQVGNQVKSRIEATADRRIKSHLVIGR